LLFRGKRKLAQAMKEAKEQFNDIQSKFEMANAGKEKDFQVLLFLM